MIEFAGFAPDADPTTPGILVSCARLIPDTRGMVSAPTPIAPVGVPAVASEAKGAAVVSSTTGAQRVIVGTGSQLLELDSTGTAWTNRSKAGGYTGGTESRWSITGFGNAIVATNDTDAMQASVGAAFSDIASAPKARIVCTAPNFVLAFNTNDATYGDSSDRWWCSAFQDHTSWTPSVTTQATTGRLVSDGGEITAAAPLGNQVVAYKERSLYLGTYVGAPVVWQWDRVPGEWGCVGPEAVADVGQGHVFVGQDNIWFFDGTRPVSIADGTVRNWFFANASSAFLYRTIVNYEHRTRLVRIFFVPASSSDGRPSRCLVYHVARGIWGVSDEQVECALQYIGGTTTFTGLGAFTYDTMPGVAYDSPYWLTRGRVAAFVNTDHQLVTLAGAGLESGKPMIFQTGFFGHDYEASMLRNVRLRFAGQEPITTASLARGLCAQGLGLTPVATPYTNKIDSGYPIRQNGRWHAVEFAFPFGTSAQVNVLGFEPEIQKGGRR